MEYHPNQIVLNLIKFLLLSLHFASRFRIKDTCKKLCPCFRFLGAGVLKESINLNSKHLKTFRK